MIYFKILLLFIFFQFSLQNKECVKSTTNVNLRDSVGGNVVKTASPGEIFIVVDKSAGSAMGHNWYKFANGLFGADSYFNATSCQKRCVCAKVTTTVNLRDSPGGSIVKKAANGENFEIVQENAGEAMGFEWYEFRGNLFGAKPYFQNCSCEVLDKVKLTLIEIFGNEGACQNQASDTGNWYDGKLGYTCQGVTPKVGYELKDKYYSYASKSFTGSKELFVKYAHDKDMNKFEEGTGNLYVDKYFYVCSQFEMPTYYICSDVSVNSGPGRSKKFIDQLEEKGKSWSKKKYATEFNELHRQFYKELGKQEKYKPYLKGWLKRAEHRDEYIETFCSSHDCS